MVFEVLNTFQLFPIYEHKSGDGHPDHVDVGSSPGCYHHGPWIANKPGFLDPYNPKGKNFYEVSKLNAPLIHLQHSTQCHTKLSTLFDMRCLNKYSFQYETTMFNFFSSNLPWIPPPSKPKSSLFLYEFVTEIGSLYVILFFYFLESPIL